MLGLAVLTIAAVAAFSTASASATELYNGATTLKSGTAIQMSLSGTFSTTTTGGTVLDTCTGGGFSGTTSNVGGTGINVIDSVAVAGMTLTGCTKTTDNLEGGTLEIAWTSGSSGSVTGKGFKVTQEWTAEFGGTCAYGFSSGVKLGEIKGSTTADATLAVNAVVNGAAGNSFICPADVKWVANDTYTSPTPLHVTNS
ncbi:MAG TPA: hypothetical protein VFX35_12360 [Solirubrobacterales bacterium]|nr:hypothetical protein [Solirubrobacterales bacterium]